MSAFDHISDSENDEVDENLYLNRYNRDNVNMYGAELS